MDGVLVGSPHDPSITIVCICHLEEKHSCGGLIPLQECLALMLQMIFFTTVNGLHSSPAFTMELPVDNKVPSVGIEIIKKGTKLEEQVYRKPVNTALVLNFWGHTDKLYKECLLKTMIHRTCALNSTTGAFDEKCTRLRSIFIRQAQYTFPSAILIKRFHEMRESVKLMIAAA